MNGPRVLDVSALPRHAFGARATLNWGVAGLIAIEGTVFALLVATYFYLRFVGTQWPPAGTPQPRLLAATINVLLLAVSIVPMVFAQRAAHRHDRRAGLVSCLVCAVLGIAFIGIRLLEFRALGCRWDSHAYGSVVWTILGMHTTHMVASVVENLLFIALLAIGPVEERHWVDLESNALYWYFVVAAWVPLYGLVFLGPRVL